MPDSTQRPMHPRTLDHPTSFPVHLGEDVTPPHLLLERCDSMVSDAVAVQKIERHQGRTHVAQEREALPRQLRATSQREKLQSEFPRRCQERNPVISNSGPCHIELHELVATVGDHQERLVGELVTTTEMKLQKGASM